MTVIGAGPVGENVAERARAAGLDAAIGERELFGGHCSFQAYDPSTVVPGRLRGQGAGRQAARQ
ncbi:pyridine nucleotide-disulfide oxidoreductase, partial [Streptomyces spiralis]